MREKNERRTEIVKNKLEYQLKLTEQIRVYSVSPFFLIFSVFFLYARTTRFIRAIVKLHFSSSNKFGKNKRKREFAGALVFVPKHVRTKTFPDGKESAFISIFFCYATNLEDVHLIIIVIVSRAPF